MTETQIGDVIVSSDGQALDMRHIHNEALRIRLDGDGIEELIDFLRSCVINEFNQRKAFRIPIFTSCGLSVTLRIFQKTWTVTPKNISLTGIFVVFPDGDTPDLDKDSEVELTVQLENKALTLRGLVRRREAKGVRYIISRMFARRRGISARFTQANGHGIGKEMDPKQNEKHTELTIEVMAKGKERKRSTD